jgi:hypothetical protein
MNFESPDNKITSSNERVLPAESAAGNTHTRSWTAEGGEKEIYDVYKLIKYAENTRAIKIEVIDLVENFDKPCWTDKNGKKISPRKIINAFLETQSWAEVESAHPEWSKHIKQIKRADYVNHPILIYNYKIVDGMHRLTRSFLEKASEIPARILPDLPRDMIIDPTLLK